MSDLTVVSSTQRIEVSPVLPRIEFDPQTQVVEVVVPPQSVGVVNAGPPGPPGADGSFDMAPVVVEIDSRVAAHNQATPIHSNATSGRDFVALFQNGLV